MSKRFKVGFAFSAVVIALTFCLLTPLFSMSHSASAVSDNDLMKKTLMSAMGSCYASNYIKQTYNTSEGAFNPGLMTTNTREFAVPTKIGNKLPNGSTIDCDEVFNGVGNGNKMRGLLTLYGKGGAVLRPENFGYKPAQAASTASYKCVYLSYNVVSNTSAVSQDSNSICFPVDNNGNITMKDNLDFACYSSSGKEENQRSCGVLDTGSLKLFESFMNGTLSMGTGSSSNVILSTGSLNGKNFNSLVQNMNDGIARRCTSSGGPYDSNPGNSCFKNISDITVKSKSDSGNHVSSDAYQSSGSNIKDTISFLTGGDDSLSSFYFDQTDFATLYYKYYEQVATANKAVKTNTGNCSADPDEYEYAMTTDGSKWCEIIGLDATSLNTQFAGRGSSSYLKNMSFKQILADWKNIDFSKVDTSGLGSVGNDGLSTGDVNGSGEGGEMSSITACFESAGVLGWIACPILEMMSGVTETMYGFIEDSLTIGSDLMGSDGIRSGWGIFRDLANIIFAIVFVLVILSQVTGIGINNYGIKKILPRLVAMVVLVNISFLLCQLAVDVSNILGSSLKGLFDGFSETVAQSVKDSEGIPGVPFDLGTVVGGLAGTGMAVGGAVAVTAVLAITIPFELWLFPIILAILGCLVSVFFFFILLGVRQAGVVILVTLAPVAIVCYALPNTKTIFDRWKKMFSGLLLVYPICGLLMGGGTFASTLLLSVSHGSDANGFFVIVAMLMNVVPFFMIPSILRGSMTAMGNLGMRISNFGNRVGSGITRGIRSSEIGKNIQRQANMRYADRAASKIENKYKDRSGHTRELSQRDKKRLDRYNTMYNRYAYEDLRAGGATTRIKPGTAIYEALEQGQKSKQFDEDVAGRQELLKNGAMPSRLIGGGKVSGNNEDGMIAELDGYLERIIDGANSGQTAQELEDEVKNAQAIMDTLSATGKGGIMARVENSFARAIDSKQSVLTAATGDVKTTLTDTFGSLGARTMRKFGKEYQKNSPGAAAMFGDIAKGEFSRAGTFRLVNELNNDGSLKVDSRGNPVQHLASSFYSGSGLSGINPGDLGKMKPHHLSNILDGIEHGDIKGSNALDVAHAADEVLSHPEQFPADADSKAYIERIRNAVLSSDAVPTGGTRTTGAMAIGRADSSAINGILNSIQGAQNWGSLSATEQARYGQLVSNIHDSLNNDMHTSENVQQLKQALSIAKGKGFVDSSTHAVVTEFTGTPTLKITRNARQKVSMPAGWARGTDGKWYDGGMIGGRKLNAAEIVKAEQIERHNNQIDIDNGTV